MRFDVIRKPDGGVKISRYPYLEDGERKLYPVKMRVRDANFLNATLSSISRRSEEKEEFLVHDYDIFQSLMTIFSGNYVTARDFYAENFSNRPEGKVILNYSDRNENVLTLQCLKRMLRDVCPEKAHDIFEIIIGSHERSTRKKVLDLLYKNLSKIGIDDGFPDEEVNAYVNLDSPGGKHIAVYEKDLRILNFTREELIDPLEKLFPSKHEVMLNRELQEVVLDVIRNSALITFPDIEDKSDIQFIDVWGP